VHAFLVLGAQLARDISGLALMEQTPTADLAKKVNSAKGGLKLAGCVLIMRSRIQPNLRACPAQWENIATKI
jgi:hypothetical protein